MSWRRWLAGAAALAGVLAPFAGRRGARLDVDALAGAVARAEDRIDAVELAAWLNARRPGLRVLDLRSAEAYAAYHIPGSEHVPLAAIARTAIAPDETVVLISQAGVHAAQAWVFLHALGHHRVLFLRRGLDEWLDDVMSPIVPDAEFDRVAALSRAFGGSPRRAGAADPPPPPPRGRGC